MGKYKLKSLHNYVKCGKIEKFRNNVIGTKQQRRRKSMKDSFKLTVPRNLEIDPLIYLKQEIGDIKDVWIYIHKSCILNMTSSHGWRFVGIAQGMRCREKKVTLVSSPVPGWYMLDKWDDYELFDIEDPRSCIGIKMQEKEDF